MRARLAVTALLVLAGCMATPDERAELDLQIGRRSAGGSSLEVAEGLACVRHMAPGSVRLWAQAPTLELTLRPGPEAPEQWDVVIDNALPDAALTIEPRRTDRPTQRAFRVLASPGSTASLLLAAPGFDERQPFRFGVLSDIQEAVDDVGDIFARMNADPALRFVVSTGDLVDHGERENLERVQRELEALDVPLYSTIGNHELIQGDPADWAALYGRFSFHFDFQGVSFTLVDSGSGTVAPRVYDWLQAWLTEDPRAPQVFLTHYPPLDPAGTRSGALSSRKEAARLIRLVAASGADLTLHGHIHSYYAFSLGGVPAYISGGGGAIPEAFDGMGRHYLVVDADPLVGSLEVAVTRVD